MRSVAPIAISLILFATLFLSNVNATSPPFTLLNNDSHFISNTHFGIGTTSQWMHPSLLYFPNGWGNINGTSYKYWLGVTGYPNGNEDYEEPAILCSNNMSDDSWLEPANNYYNTNPVTSWYWNDGDNTGGHYCDVEIVYNDDTDEIWLFIINSTRSPWHVWIEIYKTSDGVNWSGDIGCDLDVSDSADYGFQSESVVKDENGWILWGNCPNGEPNELWKYVSTNGQNWTFSYNCGNIAGVTGQEVWHPCIQSYNNEYWGLISTCNPTDQQQRLEFARSSDGNNWTSYDSYVLDIGSSGSWDNGIIYRSTFIVENGYIRVLYSANDNASATAAWYTGYTYNNSTGGTGNSSNVIVMSSPGSSINDTESFGISLPIDYTATPTPPESYSDIAIFGMSITLDYFSNGNGSGDIISDSNNIYFAIAGLAIFFPFLGLIIYKVRR